MERTTALAATNYSLLLIFQHTILMYIDTSATHIIRLQMGLLKYHLRVGADVTRMREVYHTRSDPSAGKRKQVQSLSVQ